MTHPTSHAIVERSPPDRRAQVLRQLHLGRRQIARLLVAQQQGCTDMNGLFLARRGSRLVGAAWGQCLAGNAAFCWPACLAKNEPATTADALQLAVNQYLDAAQVAVAQAIVPQTPGPETPTLIRGGFQHLTSLAYLVWSPGQGSAAASDGQLTLEPAYQTRHRQLADLIERTYVGSLDCPQVDGRRPMRDVLAGYEATGTSRPEWWLRVRHQDQDVGCLIMADHPEQNQCELVYLGVVPAARGRGWGRQIARHAQQLTAQAGRQHLVLAVDQANWPALAMYECTGFGLWDCRRVFVRFPA